MTDMADRLSYDLAWQDQLGARNQQRTNMFSRPEYFYAVEIKQFTALRCDLNSHTRVFWVQTFLCGHTLEWRSELLQWQPGSSVNVGRRIVPDLRLGVSGEGRSCINLKQLHSGCVKRNRRQQSDYKQLVFVASSTHNTPSIIQSEHILKTWTKRRQQNPSSLKPLTPTVAIWVQL